MRRPRSAKERSIVENRRTIMQKRAAKGRYGRSMLQRGALELKRAANREIWAPNHKEEGVKKSMRVVHVEV